MKKWVKSIISIFISFIMIITMTPIAMADNGTEKKDFKILDICCNDQPIFYDTPWSNEYDYKITKMRMDEFIGSKEKLIGMYDLIVLGARGIDDENGSYIDRDSFYRQENSGEYFPQNDLTLLKRKELDEFINNKGVVIIDNKLKNINDTKKFYRGNCVIKQFTNYYSDKNISNVICKDVTSSNAILEVIKEKKDLFHKRGIDIFEIKNGSSDKELNFKVKCNDDYDFKVYLDMDGDGVFSEKELIKGSYDKKDKISCPLPKLTQSYCKWRVELIEKDTKRVLYAEEGEKVFNVKYSIPKIVVLDDFGAFNRCTLSLLRYELCECKEKLGWSVDDVNKCINKIEVISSWDFCCGLKTIKNSDILIVSDLCSVNYRRIEEYIEDLADGGKKVIFLSDSRRVKKDSPIRQVLSQNIIKERKDYTNDIAISGTFNGNRYDIKFENKTNETKKDFLIYLKTKYPLEKSEQNQNAIILSTYFNGIDLDWFNMDWFGLDWFNLNWDNWDYFCTHYYNNVIRFNGSLAPNEIKNITGYDLSGCYKNEILGYKILSYENENGYTPMKIERIDRYYGWKYWGVNYGNMRNARNQYQPIIDSIEGCNSNLVASKVNDSSINNFPYVLEDSLQIVNKEGGDYYLNLEDKDVIPILTLFNGKCENGVQTKIPKSFYHTYTKDNIIYSSIDLSRWSKYSTGDLFKYLEQWFDNYFNRWTDYFYKELNSGWGSNIYGNNMDMFYTFDVFEDLERYIENYFRKNCIEKNIENEAQLLVNMIFFKGKVESSGGDDSSSEVINHGTWINNLIMNDNDHLKVMQGMSMDFAVKFKCNSTDATIKVLTDERVKIKYLNANSNECIIYKIEGNKLVSVKVKGIINNNEIKLIGLEEGQEYIINYKGIFPMKDFNKNGNEEMVTFNVSLNAKESENDIKVKVLNLANVE